MYFMHSLDIFSNASKPAMLQALADNQQKLETTESIPSQAQEIKEVSAAYSFYQLIFLL